MDPISQETKKLFELNRYVAHISYVQENEVVPHFVSKSAYYLTRVGGVIIARGNACLHRGMKLVAERRRMKPDQKIVCPLHTWSYDQWGELYQTPGFDQDMNLSCLPKLQLQELNGRMFFEKESLNAWPGRRGDDSINQLFNRLREYGVNFSEFKFDQEMISVCQQGWQANMEVYLDSYNINIRQPNTLGSYADFNDTKWQFGNEWSLQYLPRTYLNEPRYQRPAALGWSKFKDAVLDSGWSEPWAALYATIYPGMMIDCYPHAIAITQLVPVSSKLTGVYVHIFFDTYAQTDLNLQNFFLDAFSEAAEEDQRLHERLEDGWSFDQSTYAKLSDWGLHKEKQIGIERFGDWKVRQ